MSKDNRRPDLLKGLAAGLTAGFVASWTMNEFQAAWSKAAEGFEKPHGAQAMQPSQGGEPGKEDQSKEQQDNATVKAARAISENILGRELEESKKEGPVRQSIMRLEPLPVDYMERWPNLRRPLPWQAACHSALLSGWLPTKRPYPCWVFLRARRSIRYRPMLMR